MMIKRSEKIDNVLDKIYKKKGFLPEPFPADMWLSSDGDDDDPDWLFEQGIKIGKTLNNQPIYKCVSDNYICYFVGIEKEILDKLNKLI